MGAHELILAAAAGSVSLALCAVFWALAQRRQAQARVHGLRDEIAALRSQVDAAQASAEAFDSALLAIEDGQAMLASGGESLAVCARVLEVENPEPQAIVNALMRADPDHARRLRAL